MKPDELEQAHVFGFFAWPFPTHARDCAVRLRRQFELLRYMAAHAGQISRIADCSRHSGPRRGIVPFALRRAIRATSLYGTPSRTNSPASL